jgi:hypothetical protein
VFRGADRAENSDFGRKSARDQLSVPGAILAIATRIKFRMRNKNRADFAKPGITRKFCG